MKTIALLLVTIIIAWGMSCVDSEPYVPRDCLKPEEPIKIIPPPAPLQYQVVPLAKTTALVPNIWDCENGVSLSKQRACIQDSILNFVYQHLSYPPQANVKGTVLLTFLMNERGLMSNLKIEKDIGEGCGKAALEALCLFAQQQKYRPSKTKAFDTELQLTVVFE